MTRSNNLARLAQVSQLLLDVKLHALRTAASKRQQSLDLLESLNQSMADTDLALVAKYQAAQRYQQFADARRAQLNIVLARQTAEMHVARDAAGQAFGKNQALRSLQKKKL